MCPVYLMLTLVCVCVCVRGFQSEEGASLFRPFPPFHRTFPTQGSDGERDVAAPLIRTPLSPPRWPLRLKTLQRGGHRRSVLHLHHRSVSDCKEFCAFIFFWIENVSLQSALMPEYQHLTEIIIKKKNWKRKMIMAGMQWMAEKMYNLILPLRSRSLGVLVSLVGWLVFTRVCVQDTKEAVYKVWVFFG